MWLRKTIPYTQIKEIQEKEGYRVALVSDLHYGITLNKKPIGKISVQRLKQHNRNMVVFVRRYFR